jgi:hypothetical protein
METDDLYRTTLARTVELLRNEAEVAAKLRVPPGILRRWIRGSGRIAQAVFLRLVDLIAEHGSDRRRLE